MSCIPAFVTLFVVAVFCLWAIKNLSDDNDKRRKP